jgi:putative ABC transport system substrate-binding protein
MNRRDLIVLLGGGALLYTATGRAQQKAMPVIGFLSSSSLGPSAPSLAAFHQGLSEAGYVEGQNLAIEYRWAEFRQVEVIATNGEPRAALAAKIATPTIPIVFNAISDPVSFGLVASLARPGGNLTGVSPMTTELMPKRLELLSELVPQAGVIALLVDPNNVSTEPRIRDMQEAARAKGVELPILKASTESEIDDALASLAQLRVGVLSN